LIYDKDRAQFDGVIVNQDGSVAAYVEVKAAPVSSARAPVKTNEAPNDGPQTSVSQPSSVGLH
jgi:hypothetical protein